MGHIFISYSHKDSKYVEKLEKKLIDEGFDVWIDHRIDYGSEWPKEIQKALDSCDAFIVVVSENAYKSKWVQNEVARADRKGKPFFPLLLQGDPWLSVETIQYVNVTSGSLPPEKFYNHLATVTERKKKDEPVDSSIKEKPVAQKKLLGQKTVRFLRYQYERDFTDSFVCVVKFSVVDTHLVGTPYEIETTHKVKIILSDILMSFWDIPRALELENNNVSDEMVKIALQSAEEYIASLIKRGDDLDDEIAALERNTENSPKSCPYKITNIAYPTKDTFVVNFDDKISSLVDEKRNQSESRIINFPPNKHKYSSNMKDGPILNDQKAVYFGTYKTVKFSKKDLGKSLKIYVNSVSEKVSPWIELWRGTIDGDDYKTWTNNRVRVVWSPKEEKPSLLWAIEEGEYTIYIVADGEYNYTEPYMLKEKIKYFDISYIIEIISPLTITSSAGGG